jgi:XTP/dITP diphosphohydrolase
MTLRYVTTNPGKVREAEEYLDDAVEALAYDYTEIQAPELEPIAARGAREAFRHAGAPVIVDDAGLFVESLGGFPGPYSAYVEETLGVERTGRVARAAAGEDAVARAAFRCVVAYCDGDSFEATPEPVDRGERRGQDLAAADRDAATTDEQVAGGDVPVKLFTGVVPGRIVEPRGDGGFGYDPVFEHDGTTFAEMSPAEKNAVSHRGRALAKFADWYAER